MGPVSTGATDESRKERADYEVLVGTWRGRSAEFCYATATPQPFGLPRDGMRTDLDARISIYTRGEVESFEVTNKHANGVLVPNPGLHLPKRSFQRQDLDAIFELRCERPDLGPALAPAVERLVPAQWLHLVGAEGMASHIMNLYSVPTAAMNARLFLDGLSEIAAVLDDRASAG